jgi:hypothetical protein
LKPAFQFFAKNFKINWPRDARVTAGFEETLLFGDHGVRRHRNHRDSIKSGLFSHPRSQGKTVLIAELNIQQDGMWPAILEGTYGGRQIFNTGDFVPFDFEPVAKEFSIQRIVFNHRSVRAAIVCLKQRLDGFVNFVVAHQSIDTLDDTAVLGDQH